MNTQIHRKQIIILVLAMALAAASYWIPVPRKSELYSSSMLRESSTLSAPTETITYVREPATIWRFPVTIQAPRTPVPAASVVQMENTPSIDGLPSARLMDQRDFADDDIISSPLMPVKELNYDLKR